MSWFTDPNCEAEALKEHAAMCYAVDLDFPSGHVRLCTWSGDITINGNTYMGIGTLGSIAETPEETQLVANGWSYTLSGVNPSVVPESEIDGCFNRSVAEYEVWLNSETHAVIGYELNREGTMGRVRRRDGAQPIIEVSVEHRLSILEQPDSWRYTTEHQAKFFSGDLGFDFVRQLDSVEIIWGGKRTEAGSPGIPLRGHVG